MDKSEALSVFREVVEACKNSGMFECTSLEPKSEIVKSNYGGYFVKMECYLDDPARECVRNVAKKRGLVVTEQSGYIIVGSH